VLIVRKHPPIRPDQNVNVFVALSEKSKSENFPNWDPNVVAAVKPPSIAPISTTAAAIAPAI
jgi:hypothetical protein